MSRELQVGARLWSYPCVAKVVRIEGTTAWAYCFACREQHAVDKPLHETGRGPWLGVEQGGEHTRRAALRAAQREWEWDNPRCPLCEEHHAPDACAKTAVREDSR